MEAATSHNSHFSDFKFSRKTLSIVALPVGLCGFQAPENAKTESDFVCFRVAQAMEFDVVGVIARISSVLAAAKIPIFVVSTFDTDYVFVKQEFLERAKSELSNNGYHWIN